MRRLLVDSRTGSYPVVVGAGLLSTVADELERLLFSQKTKVTVITDDTVATLPLLKTVTDSLEASEFTYQVVKFPAGDASKSLDAASSIYPKLLSFGMRRSDVIIALGGGVVGDLAGFVAATYLRGIAFIQVPTTLLAHDSSIGGKVGVNLPEGKNLVGAFYPPRAVLFDLDALSFLPDRQWTNGMAEVIKHGLIADAELFDELEANPLVVYPGATSFEPILASAMQVKIDVVQADEREANRRQVLNLGHTIGHAIEQRSHYALGHGEAISIGMVLEAKLALERGLLSQSDAGRIRCVLQEHGLPVVPQKDDWVEIRRVMDVDKKHKDALWTFALPRRVGEVDIVSDVHPDEVQRVYEQAFEEEQA